MIIELQVQRQRIQGVNQIPRLIVEDSRHFVFLNMDFDEEWDGLTTTVIFSNDHAKGGDVEILWTGKPIEVPEEMLVAGTMRVSCVGVGNEGLYVTTEYMSNGIRVYRSGEQSGLEPGSTVPGLWEQVLATVGSLDALNTEDQSSMVAAINEIHGKSIKSIEQTVFAEADGGINEFTITQTNGTKTVLQVRNGRTGDKGDIGVGIKSIVCEDDFTWTVTYTDGTTQTIDNAAYHELVNYVNGAATEALAATEQALDAATRADASIADVDEKIRLANAAAGHAQTSAAAAQDAAAAAREATKETNAAADNANAATEAANAATARADTATEEANAAAESANSATNNANLSANRADNATAAANAAAENANKAEAELRAAAEAGEFDGKPFTHDMFTPEQLASLTGPKGDTGVGYTGEVWVYEGEINSVSGGGYSDYHFLLTDGTEHVVTVYHGKNGANLVAVNALANQKADNLYYDTEAKMLYLTSGGSIIGDGVTVSAGGTGGGGSTNNAVMTLKNTSGWNYKAISEGGECPISFTWSSLEDELETGSGVLKITVGGSTKHTAQIPQGDHTIDIGPMLAAGDNAVKINVTDVYGNERTLSYTLNVVSLKLTSSFDGAAAYTGDIAYFYVPTAAAEKMVYFKLDGETIGTQTVTVSGRQQNFTIPAPGHGCHSFEVYYTAEINGETVPSNHLYYSLICLEEGNTTPVIATTFRGTTAEQYETVVIPYRVYDPASLTANINLSTSESADVKPLTVDRTEQTWSYMPETAGDLTLSISCGTKVLMIGLTVTETTMEVEAETENLSLHLTSYGRSNNEENPGQWQHGDIVAALENFNFTSDGWVQDEDGITVLRISGDARVTIPAELFKTDFRTGGKTIEIEFASRNVLNYDTEIMNCWSGDRGITITAQQALMKSEQSSVNTKYKEDEHLRLSFVVEKRSGNRLILVYINGIISGMLQYPDDDDFSQAAPVGISLGSNDCTTDIYNIRVYDNDLTRYQILDNWIADTQVMAEKKDRYDRNDVYDEYGLILPTTLKSSQKYLILNGPVLPQSKGDKKTISGTFVDPVDGRGFTFTGAEIDVQGTSSQYYYVKNYKIKFKNGFRLENGTTVEDYALNEQAVPVHEFTFKADVASSEGANNVVLARLYNEVCPVKTPPQEADPKVRQTIDGFPIVVFHDDGTGPKFIGKYNFNNDKGTAETFGFAAGDQSWEILENGNALVGFKTADFTNWQTSFEARYPEDSTDISQLQQFVAWVASTDTDAVSTEGEKAARLAKFKDELADWADVDALIFYYVFTELFLCIDQREKNAFPTLYQDLGKWIMLFYDADSSLGTDNKGNLAFDYYLEDIDFTDAGDPVFNGQNSVLWVNLRKCFADEIKAEYQRLRTEVRADGRPLLSYDVVNEMFEQHQSQWSEAIYNEDAWRKAVEPLEQGDAQYLPMQQGKKEHHFKWWMYNRFRYLDGKYETGDSMNDRIMVRAHAQANVKLTGYANMYGRVYYNADCDTHRMTRGVEQEFEWKATGAEDAVIGINDAALLTSIGDLAPLMAEDVNIAGATHLTSLKVGDGAADYVNDNLTALTLGNNRLLKTLDVRNCTALTQAVDASGCQNIEEVYFDNTAITGLSLPNGGILKKLHLPATMTNLTIRNQTKLTEFVMPGYGNITTLRLENVPAVVPDYAILAAIPANSRVRMIGFDWTLDSAEAALALYDRLDTMRGLDENGGNVDKAQMQGTVRIDSLTGAQLSEMQSRYPNITVVYQHITYSLCFYDEMGENLLYTATVADGADGEYGGLTPTKDSTPQYSYTHIGWSLTPGGDADENALKAVTADRNVYAAFEQTVRTYTVKWYNGSTLIEVDTGLAYGATPEYNGSTPVDETNGLAWLGWEPEVGPVADDVSYVAVFEQPVDYAALWTAVANSIEAGTYKDVYKVGDTVPLDLGSEGVINMQIAAFDTDTLADGSGTAAISWVAVELLKTKHPINPAANGDAEGTGNVGGWEKCQMRAYLGTTIKPLIPSFVRSMIVTVAKTHGYKPTSEINEALQTTHDDLWIPSRAEVGYATSVETNLPSYSGVYSTQDSRKKTWLAYSYFETWVSRSSGSNGIWHSFNGSGRAITVTGGTTGRCVCLCFCTGVTPTT